MLAAPVRRPVLVIINPGSLHGLAVDGAQTRVQLLGRLPHRAVVRGRVEAAPLLSARRLLAGAVTRLHLSYVFVFRIFLHGAALVSQTQFLGHVLHQQQALSRDRTGASGGLFLSR